MSAIFINIVLDYLKQLDNKRLQYCCGKRNDQLVDLQNTERFALMKEEVINSGKQNKYRTYEHMSIYDYDYRCLSIGIYKCLHVRVYV